MLADCLAGIRVLDLSQYIPGPFCTLLLSDMGAEVVKVEPPQGDPMRTFGAADGDGLSPFYKLLNRNKAVVRLDLKSEAGQEAFRRMVESADVLLESFRPGVMERLGFGRDRLRALNPGLVHCALSGYGQTGPFRLRAGHDLTYVAMTGSLAGSGTAATPVMTFPPLADHAGAMQATVSILAALLRRGRSGQGAAIDVSLFESLLSWQYWGLTLGRRGQNPRREHDLLNGGAAYYRIYRTRDGKFAAFAPIEEKFWAAFCTAAERPDLLPRQSEPLPQTSLISELEQLFASRSLADWEALLGPADCCFEPVLEPSDVPGHPHIQARGLIAASDGADATAEILFPALIDGMAPPPRKPLREVSAADLLAEWRE